MEIQRAEGPAIISLGFTKGGKRMGAAESVTTNVFDVTRRLWQWKASSTLQLATTASAWRTEFANTLKALNLERFEFRPYSLRRGGATFWFSKHGSLDRLLIQGRWQAARTARIYINEGMAILAEIQVPSASLRSFLHVYSRSLDKSLPQLEHTRKTSRAGGRGKKDQRRGKNTDFVRIRDGVSLFLFRVLEAKICWLGSDILGVHESWDLSLSGLAERFRGIHKVRDWFFLFHFDKTDLAV